MCVCVCVCVCLNIQGRENQREGGKGGREEDRRKEGSLTGSGSQRPDISTLGAIIPQSSTSNQPEYTPRQSQQQNVDPVYIRLFTFEDADFQLCRCFSRGKRHKQSKTRNTGRSLFTNNHSRCSYRLSVLSISWTIESLHNSEVAPSLIDILQLFCYLGILGSVCKRHTAIFDCHGTARSFRDKHSFLQSG